MQPNIICMQVFKYKWTLTPLLLTAFPVSVSVFRNRIMCADTRCYLAQVKRMLPGTHVLATRSQMFILGWGWSFTGGLRCCKAVLPTGGTVKWIVDLIQLKLTCKKKKKQACPPDLPGKPADSGGTWARASISLSKGRQQENMATDKNMKNETSSVAAAQVYTSLRHLWSLKF